MIGGGIGQVRSAEFENHVLRTLQEMLCKSIQALPLSDCGLFSWLVALTERTECKRDQRQTRLLLMVQPGRGSAVPAARLAPSSIREFPAVQLLLPSQGSGNVEMC